MMHKNFLWQSFLLLVAGCALVYTAIAASRTYCYMRLNETAPPLAMDWNTKELSSDRYILETSYQFNIKGQLFSGKTSWSDTAYLNPWAAEKAIEENRKKTWTIWYDPAAPSYSSLQKKLPIKQWASAALLWILSLYFFGVGCYVSKYKP
jgi:hypothetical protein